MAKVTGPLMSFGASGSLAKTMVASKWKGRPYFRQHVTPANPQSAEQTKTRSLFAWLSGVWKNLGSIGIAPWNRFAVGQVLTGRNAFMGNNVGFMRDQIDAQDMQASPGAKGGPAPSSVSAAGGVGTVTATITAPTPPTGWTLTAVQALAIEDQDPQSAVLFTTYEGEDTADPKDTVALTVPAGDYVVFGWTKWAKPDGSVAYGPSISDLATAT